MPRFARRAASAVAAPIMERTMKNSEALDLVRRLGADEELFWGAAVVFDETLKAELLSPAMRARWSAASSYEVVRPYLENFEAQRPESDFLARMTYLELKLRLPELLLMRVDKITMATSVEARVPFLDHRLVEYALGVPREFKIEGASGKHILKRALEKSFVSQNRQRRSARVLEFGCQQCWVKITTYQSTRWGGLLQLGYDRDP